MNSNPNNLNYLQSRNLIKKPRRDAILREDPKKRQQHAYESDSDYQEELKIK